VRGAGGTTGTAGRGGPARRCRARPDPRSATTASTTTATTSLTVAEPGCFGDPRCAPLGQEICNNNLDDDADPHRLRRSDCMNSISCRPTMGMEICDNGIDDNRNSLVDCADPQCTMFPGCLAVSCTADVDFGTIATHGASVSRAMNTTGGGQGLRHLRALRWCRPGRPVPARRDGGRPPRLQAGLGQRARHRPVPRGASQSCDRNPWTA
jgi:hypothetical protein